MNKLMLILLLMVSKDIDISDGRCVIIFDSLPDVEVDAAKYTLLNDGLITVKGGDLMYSVTAKGKRFLELLTQAVAAIDTVIKS